MHDFECSDTECDFILKDVNEIECNVSKELNDFTCSDTECDLIHKDFDDIECNVSEECRNETDSNVSEIGCNVSKECRSKLFSDVTNAPDHKKPTIFSQNENDEITTKIHNYIKLGCLNVRSICGKIEQLQKFVGEQMFDILSINETWLDESVSDHEIEIPGYMIVRKDRNRRGGGVCFYVKDHIDCHVRNDIGNSIESIWLSVKHKGQVVIIGTMYRPPKSDKMYYDIMLDEIQRARDISDHVILMGDLNYDYVMDDTLSKNPVFHIEKMLSMKQLIRSPTRTTLTNKSLLDVILTSDCEKHVNNTVINISMSDHDCVSTEYKLTTNSEKQKHKLVYYREYKQFNTEAFLNELNNEQAITNVEFCEDDFLIKWNKFRLAFNRISDQHAPIKSFRVKERFIPWIDSDVVEMMYERDHLKKKAVKTKNEAMWYKYRSLRNQITLKIRNNKKRYYQKKLDECGKDPKKMWKCINKITGNNIYKPPHRDLNCHEFNDHFSTIGEKVIATVTNTSNKLPWKQPTCRTTFSFKKIDTLVILKLLQKLEMDSNTDTLGFDKKLLRISADLIAPILCKFFNMSLKTSVVPDDWKIAKVTPVFKGKGEMADVNNYRPISLIGHIPKVFEVAVHRQLLYYFQHNNLISIDQSAYLKLHNTQTALHRVLDDWIDDIAHNTYSGICAFDIKKCFDTIDHSILLQKLGLYGILGKELQWFRSYLFKRSQIVKCHGNISDQRIVKVGVPQGSVLGPLLFVIFINDISQHVGLSTVNLFADDTLVYCTADNVFNTNEKLQHSVNEIMNWYTGNNIVVNEDKCCSMIVGPKKREESNLNIKVNECDIKHVKSMKYLGLDIDDALSWDNYTTHLGKILFIKCSKLARLSKVLSKVILIKIYNSTIQPNIDYAISIWGCTSQANIDKIQRFQNYCARIIENNFDYIGERGINLVKKLGWMTIKQRCYYFQNLLIFKSIHGLAPQYMINNVILELEIKEVRTRRHDLDLFIPKANSEFHKRMLFYRGARSWNELPRNIKDCENLNQFKRLLKRHIKSSNCRIKAAIVKNIFICYNC